MHDPMRGRQFENDAAMVKIPVASGFEDAHIDGATVMLFDLNRHMLGVSEQSAIRFRHGRVDDADRRGVRMPKHGIDRYQRERHTFEPASAIRGIEGIPS